jgi:NitT/TauT family transport system substrate-binding protein
MSRIRIYSIISAFICLSLIFVISCKREVPREETITILLDWKPGAEHAFLYAGRYNNYFKDEGFDLKIIAGTGSSDSANMVDAKTVSFALCSGETALQARASEPPRKIVCLGIFYPNTPTVIYSLGKKNINVPKDLYGKKLGIIKGSSAYRNYLYFANLNKLERDKIEEIPCTGDIREVFSDNPLVDCMVHFGFQQPLLLKMKGENISEIELAKYGMKVYGQGLITHQDLIETKPKIVERFTRAVQRSYQYTLKNPEVALQIFLNNNPDQDKLYAKAKLEWVNNFVSSGIIQNKPIGYQEESAWEETQKYLLQQDNMKRKISLSGFWTNQYLDKSIMKLP